MVSSPNPKTWYRYCKTLYKGSAIRDSIPPLTTDGAIASSPSQKAAALNRTFISRASNTIDHRMPSLPIYTAKHLDWLEITEHMVQSAIQKLDTSKAPGPDNINNLILKKCVTSLCTPLTTLFRRSFAEGVLPQLATIPYRSAQSDMHPCCCICIYRAPPCSSYGRIMWAQLVAIVGITSKTAPGCYRLRHACMSSYCWKPY